jgi:hypothetical protein
MGGSEEDQQTGVVYAKGVLEHSWADDMQRVCTPSDHLAEVHEKNT